MKSLRPILGVISALVLTLFLAACGGDDSSSSSSSGSATSSGTSTAAADSTLIKPIAGASSKPTITVGSKNFTEQFILGQIYSQALQAAGFKVKKSLNLGSEIIANKALTTGRIDAYPEYTGTALTSFFGVKTADVPRDGEQAYQQVKADYAKEDITALPKTQFENTFRLGMTKAEAAKIGNPTKISDLAQSAKDLKINGFPECRQRNDCLIGLQDTYGFKFKSFVASEQKYQTLKSGAAQVAFVFTTDGDLASGDFVVLDDDKKFFPPYNVSFNVRNSTYDEIGPEGVKVLEAVQKPLTNQIMQELNARVDVDKQTPAAAAKEYLQAGGFIAK